MYCWSECVFVFFFFFNATDSLVSWFVQYIILVDFAHNYKHPLFTQERFREHWESRPNFSPKKSVSKIQISPTFTWQIAVNIRYLVVLVDQIFLFFCFFSVIRQLIGIEWGVWEPCWGIRMMYTRCWNWRWRSGTPRSRFRLSLTGDSVTHCFIRFRGALLLLFSSSILIFETPYVSHCIPFLFNFGLI